MLYSELFQLHWVVGNSREDRREDLTLEMKIVFKSESEWVEWVETYRLTRSRLGVEFWAESTPNGQFGYFFSIFEGQIALMKLILTT